VAIESPVNKVALVDVLGNVVYDLPVSNSNTTTQLDINVQDLPAGSYQLLTTSDSGLVSQSVVIIR
jgi:hypothetical protein